MYVSFPGMMQDDKGNIKANLGIASIQQLAGFYRSIIIFCLYTDTALYNIPIGLKYLLLLTCISEMRHVQDSHIFEFLLDINT